MYKRRYHSRLYGWFLSLASVMILTGLQLRTQLLLTRQITEQPPALSTNNDIENVSLFSYHHRHHPSESPISRHLVLSKTPEFVQASFRKENDDDDSSAVVQYVRVHMHSVAYTASCLQSLLSSTMTEHGRQVEIEYDGISIVLDATTTTTDDETNLVLLMQRLHQRYPATQLFVHRRQQHRNSNTTTTSALETYSESFFSTHDKDATGSWGDGDACYWFQKETEPNVSIPRWIEFNPRKLQPAYSSQPQQSPYSVSSFYSRMRRQLGDSKNHGHTADHALSSYEYYYYSNDKQSITVHNPFDTERMLYLTYKIGPDEALTRILLDGVPTVVVEPYREPNAYSNNERKNGSNDWETSPVGKVGPHQVIKVQWDHLSSPLADDDGMFRLLGVGFGVHSIKDDTPMNIE